MTSAQPQLIPIPADHPVRELLRDVPVIVGHGLRSALRADGRRMSGTITLDKPNPKGRLKIGVDYIAPKSWNSAHHQSALAVAAHWFRDIGGLLRIRKAHLGHIVQRLQEGATEQELHAAVSAYAASPWHRERKCWLTINSFFTRDAWEQWADKAHASAENARSTAEVKRRPLSPEEQEWRDQRARKAAAEEAKRQTELQLWLEKRRAERALESQPPSEQPTDYIAPANPDAIDLAIQSIPQRDRWVLPSLLSRSASPETKSGAKLRAPGVVRALWPMLPDAIRSDVDDRIRQYVRNQTGHDIAVEDLTAILVDKLRAAHLPAVVRLHRRPRR